MTDPLSYTAAFVIGLLGGVHCIGMCGGIVNALSFAVPVERRGARQLGPILLSYNLGRICSYSVAGALVGVLGDWLQSTGNQAGPALRIVAGLMLIAMGLYLAGWWRGLVHLEQLGGHLWKRLQPLGQRLMPVTCPGQALVLGSLWGWLPCGLVYSTLTWSATAAAWPQSALLMLCFGLGTLPVMLLTGAFAHQLKAWTQHAAVRNVAALLVIAFGVWTMGSMPLHRSHFHGEPTGAQPHSHQLGRQRLPGGNHALTSWRREITVTSDFGSGVPKVFARGMKREAGAHATFACHSGAAPATVSETDRSNTQSVMVVASRHCAQAWEGATTGS